MYSILIVRLQDSQYVFCLSALNSAKLQQQIDKLSSPAAYILF